MSDEEQERHSSPKAVIAAFLLVGVALIAIALFSAVLLNRTC